MIIAGSRYSESSETRNGQTVNVALPTSFNTGNYFTIIAVDGDTFETLAARYLTGPSVWWKLADINKHVAFPDFITPGTTIRIPVS